ncbi:MAG: hypothetical protein QXQ82_01955 [Candidatus Pacearchaeota archaeon]
MKGKKIFIFLLLIGIFFASVFFLKKEISGLSEPNFQYKSLEFVKTNLDNLTLYATSVLLKNNGISMQTFYFRNDPRKLDKIPFDAEMNITKRGYVSFTPQALDCEEVNIAAWNIGYFFARIGTEMKAGVTEKTEKSNATIINCSSSDREMIVILKAQARKTKIYQDKENKNCIIIEAKECKLIEATERLILEVLLKQKA